MNLPRAIFFDVDNTLYRPDFIPPSAEKALAAVREKNILTAIATGRSLKRLPQPIARACSRGEFPLIIASNGQHTTYRGQTLCAHHLPPADIGHLISQFDAAGWACLCSDERYLVVSGTVPCPADSVLQSEAGFFTARDYYRQHPIYQMTVFCPLSEDSQLTQILHNTPYQRVRNNEHCADILPTTGGKERGIIEACAALGIDVAQTAAFGDGHNDVGMFAVVGRSVAMGNACAALQERADIITTTVDEDGIAKGLQALGILAP